MNTENALFEKIHFSATLLPKGEYEYCTFKDCDFSGADLSGYTFEECRFENCNMSMIKLKNTGLKTVTFQGCKLLGVNFSDCNPFLLALGFTGCSLNLASFYKLKLKATVFRNCSLQEADLTEAELAGATFDNCELSGTIFMGTMLEKADLRTSRNYSIDPEVNRIKQARFSLEGVPGLLDKYNLEIS